MNPRPAADLPHMLGLLPDAAVTKYLSRSVQAGLENPPLTALQRTSTYLPETEPRWLTAPARELLDVAMHRFEENDSVVDGWLAPRLHATLRMTRAEAADRRLWNFLSMIVAPDYVLWRHKSKASEIVPSARFSGPHYTQAFSRLWWAAELFRNGEDYRPVEVACRSQDVLNSTMRLDVVDHRPTALAFLRVLEEKMAGGASRIGDMVNALSPAINAAGSTIVYDVLAPDEPSDSDALRYWIDESRSTAPVQRDRLPDGPPDGVVNEDAVQALLPLFRKLLDEAPLRKRKKTTDKPEDK